VNHETYTLAPSVVVEKARRLAAQGLHKQALELLERNHIEVDVYPTRVEMRLPYEVQGRRQRERMLGDRRMARTNRERRKRAQVDYEREK
jgi:hypothetical protein